MVVVIERTVPRMTVVVVIERTVNMVVVGKTIHFDNCAVYFLL